MQLVMHTGFDIPRVAAHASGRQVPKAWADMRGISSPVCIASCILLFYLYNLGQKASTSLKKARNSMLTWRSDGQATVFVEEDTLVPALLNFAVPIQTFHSEYRLAYMCVRPRYGRQPAKGRENSNSQWGACSLSDVVLRTMGNKEKIQLSNINLPTLSLNPIGIVSYNKIPSPQHAIIYQNMSMYKKLYSLTGITVARNVCCVTRKITKTY